MLKHGGSVVLVESFRTDEFWDIVRRTRSTSTQLLGVMAQFLLKQPPSPSDRDHTLKSALIIPLAEDNHEFSSRFGTDVFTMYNMTEMPVPIGLGDQSGDLREAAARSGPASRSASSTRTIARCHPARSAN